MLPQSNWKDFLVNIKTAGEEGCIDQSQLGDDYEFWEEVGIFDSSAPGELTNSGKVLFESLYIRCDGGEMDILQKLLLSFPPTIAIQQYLWGVSNITVEQVVTVLKTTGYWCYDSTKPATHFLDLLNYVGIVKYQKKLRQVKILISPDACCVPKNIFIDQTRPFSNIIWIKRVIGECEKFIYWLDKHFQKEALEWIWAVADNNKIQEIKILSLDLGEKNLNSSARKDYSRFKQEMKHKGIEVTWAIINKDEIRDAHDRWIIGGNEYLRNVPNVNAISSGQKSEMNSSDNYNEVLPMFEDYWKKGREI